jgi:hypothetical protein
MFKPAFLAAAALLPPALLAAAPLAAAPGGDIGTMPIGYYVCEVPGTVDGPAANRLPAEDFQITGASSYQAASGRGSYLLTGSSFTMTSGPRNGERFLRQSEGFLRKLGADGQPGPVRCVRRNQNND